VIPQHTSCLCNAIILALVSTTTGTALAQSIPAQADDAQILDAITVTGSRISVPGVDTSSPVASVERAEFLTTQPVAVESFLKEFPALTPSIGPATNIADGPGGGAATINMRGLGDNRTLVLVDGRRPVPFNLSNVVDTNTIPLSLLQSVEMLTGGASVVYGADAVAGVTNFILRRDFEGVEINSNWGETSKGDGARQGYEATFGTLSEDGRSNAVLSIGYSKVDPVLQANRPWSRFPLDSLTGERGGSGGTVPARIIVNGLTRQIDPASGELVPSYFFYNPLPFNYYQTALDRWQVTGLARHEFNRHLESYAQVSYTRSQVGSEQAPSGIFGESLQVPLNNPYLPDAMRQQLCSELAIAAANCASGRAGPDADGELIYTGLGFFRRLAEMRTRRNDFDTKTFQTTLGLRGNLNDHWKYDAWYSYGESDQLQVAGNWGSLSKVRQAINATNVDECIDPSNGCIPLNLFGADGSITQAQLDFIQLSAYSMQKVEQTNAAFNVDGELGNFKSPWADYPVGISAGVEYRRTTAGVRSDSAFQAPGEILGTGASRADSRGGFSVKEFYAESIIPLVTEVSGAENLSVEFGYRRSEFSNTGGFDDSYGSWKYGLSWAPLEPLKLRAMKQRATRAPNIAELFTSGRTEVGTLNADPCVGNAINQADANTPGTLSWLCAQTGVPFAAIGSLAGSANGQAQVFLSGNPALAPEKADTTTLGLVWTPTDRISLTLDWWDIEINDAISSPQEQDVINGCYGTELNPGFTFNENCALVGRNTLTGNFNGAESRGIALPLTNSGFIHKTGLDLGARFAHSLPGTLGRMQYALDISKVTRDDFQATPISIRRDCLGYYSSSCLPSHQLRSNLRATWNIHDLSFTLAWRYFGNIGIEPLADEADGPFFAPYQKIAAYSYFDLGVNWNAPWNASIRLSVNNVLDKTPPLIGNNVRSGRENSGNTLPQWYDALGRYVNLGVSVKF